MKSNDLAKMLKSNVREYTMYLALLVIMGVFAILTSGLFVSPRNIATLMNQSGYIAVLAVGMTLVIVIRHIDLSVGFLAGFLGAISAIALAQWNLPVWIVIPMILLIGVITGLITAFLVAHVGVPAFVATLAGWLIYRGVLQTVTGKGGTIIIKDEAFNAISNGFIPDLFAGSFLPGMHKLTLVIGLIAMVLFVLADLRKRESRIQYNFEVLSLPLYIVRLVVLTSVIGFLFWTFASYNGLSWTVVIVMSIVLAYHFITTRTVLGRHIYAVGSNPEAATLSGISVKKITYIVFGSMGLMSAVAGILFASRSRSAAPTAGTLFELDAIAAAYIGGVSAAGGVGKVSGSLIGAIVYFALTSGMNLTGTDASLQLILRGVILLVFVIIDVLTRKRKL